MPRMARVKSDESVYHVMVRSISEIKMLEEREDKLKYIFFIKRAIITYKFRVLAYCIMDNHAHFVIDGSGVDISKVMHNINFCYAMYYNKTHDRHGHLFQDRFKSRIVFDDRYLLNLTAYIHNNPHDIQGYEDCPERYEFSSLSTYLGMDVMGSDPLVSTSLIEGVMGKNLNVTRDAYMELVRSATDENMEAKALAMYLMRCLCDFTCRDMCSTFGGITQSTASRYCMEGVELIWQDRYRSLVDDFLAAMAA